VLLKLKVAASTEQVDLDCSADVKGHLIALSVRAFGGDAPETKSSVVNADLKQLVEVWQGVEIDRGRERERQRERERSQTYTHTLIYTYTKEEINRASHTSYPSINSGTREDGPHSLAENDSQSQVCVPQIGKETTATPTTTTTTTTSKPTTATATPSQHTYIHTHTQTDIHTFILTNNTNTWSLQCTTQCTQSFDHQVSYGRLVAMLKLYEKNLGEFGSFVLGDDVVAMLVTRGLAYPRQTKEGGQDAHIACWLGEYNKDSDEKTKDKTSLWDRRGGGRDQALRIMGAEGLVAPWDDRLMKDDTDEPVALALALLSAKKKKKKPRRKRKAAEMESSSSKKNKSAKTGVRLSPISSSSSSV
jgi:hypothetical protein